MSKKAGIVTFHNALSYGAVLQSYALQQFLFKNKIDNEIVDYKCEYMDKRYKSLIHTVKGHRLKSFIGSLIKLKNKRKSLKLSEIFRKKYLVMSKNITRDKIHSIADDYSFFIAGSDQVWSPDCVGFDKTYFLDFAKSSQKYSYAASFGTSKIPEDKVDEYKRLLCDFNSYSVREESGKEIINSLLNKEAQVNIDPTLLLTPEEWDKLTTEINIKEPYIFLFNVLKPKQMIDYAIKLSKEKNMPVYYLNDKHIPIKGIKYIEPVSADKFVSLIKNAEYVVTNSFHGSVFSILYHKKLIMELDTATKRNTRSEELLKLLGIENAEINTKGFDPEAKTDWNKVDYIIEQQRQLSHSYLSGIIKERNNNE